MTRKQAKTAWKIILWANWAIIAWFWFRGLNGAFSSGAGSALVALGRLAGLAGAFMILQQFFFMGRLPWLERVFGLDALSRLHHENGKRGIILLLLHPILLIIGYGKLSGLSLLAETKSLIFDQWETVLSALGLLLFLVVVVTSIVIVRSRLKYELWYFVHLIAYAAVALSFFHQVALGSDVLATRFFYAYWLALYIVVFGAHVIFRFARPVRNYFRHHFRIADITRETGNVVSLSFSGDHMERFTAKAGQFMLLRFFAKGMWWQSHPFSVSAVPDGKRLRVTIKELGDFTKQVAALPIGTGLLIDGPYGVFTEDSCLTGRALLIAGGIGITPIRSLMERLLMAGKDVVLLYANRSESDIVFRGELEELCAARGGRIVHVISHQDDFQGERGMLDKDMILRLVPDATERDVYVCGPPPMLNALVSLFTSLGVGERLHYEIFSLG